MSFYKRPNHERMKIAGDIAEGAFERWAKKHGIVFRKYGFDRGFPNYFEISPFIRASPDYLATRGSTAPVAIEVKGTGRADHIKVKDSDLKQLDEWNQFIKVFLFFYDSHTNTCCMYSLEDISEKAKISPTGIYPDNKKLYYKIPKAILSFKEKVPNETG